MARSTVLQTDANLATIKTVVRETEGSKQTWQRISATPYIGNETLFRTGAHGISCVSVGPSGMQNLEMIRALESVENRDPIVSYIYFTFFIYIILV